MQSSIRNFCIISHIDHGKSTLADRFLELTETVEKRKMREQYLDQMELERERGITIKMQPVRMIYEIKNPKFQILTSKQIPNPKFQIPNMSLGFSVLDLEFANSRFILNLIDTPGHIDFSYEVSRALKAVEGAILLVDAISGVQAQTFYHAETAKASGLAIIPVINKIDLPYARVEETRKEINQLLNCKLEDILEISAKTGEGVEKLLEEIVKKIPPPPAALAKERKSEDSPQALIFDFGYSPHKGVIAYARLMAGKIRGGDELFLVQAKKKFIVQEVGFFHPELQKEDFLQAGEIGYIVTGIKEPRVVRVGDTVVSIYSPLPALEGYFEPKPVVWAGVYPESQDDFNLLKQSLERLRLSDSALTFEEEPNAVLGRGFKCGFLGMLHLEIVVERLRREFNLKLITATPSVVYSIYYRDGQKDHRVKDFGARVNSAVRFPDESQIEKVFEPWIETQIITPGKNLGEILKILQKHGAEIGETEQFGLSRVSLKAKMALREFMRNFFDELKTVSEGFASLSYKILGMREADVGRLDILVGGEIVPAFSRVIRRKEAQTEAMMLVKKLKDLLPRQLFAVRIQARFANRIIASENLAALKKDVTGYLYGGDRTRKMKLWQKQKAGKSRLKERGKVRIPQEVFLKMVKS
jgi:GTP-binding protein LepA